MGHVSWRFFSPLLNYPIPDPDPNAHSPASEGSCRHGGAFHIPESKNKTQPKNKLLILLSALEAVPSAGPSVEQSQVGQCDVSQTRRGKNRQTGSNEVVAHANVFHQPSFAIGHATVHRQTQSTEETIDLTFYRRFQLQ